LDGVSSRRLKLPDDLRTRRGAEQTQPYASRRLSPMPNERLERMLKDALDEIDEAESKIRPLRETANMIAAQLGEAPPFPELDKGRPQGRGLRLKPDQFAHHSAPSPAAREFLEWRKQHGGGAAALDEVYQALVEGGYPFEGRDGSAIKAGLKIALAKDKKVEELSNGHYGMRAWYGRKDRKGARGEAGAEADNTASEDDSEAGNEEPKEEEAT
jgi:hypothetical protein